MDYDSQSQLLDSYDKLLNPESLKQNLILASLYLTMYEMMKSSIMDHVKGLFFFGNDMQRQHRYNSEVLQLHPKDAFHAACLWVKKNGGLTDADIVELHVLRERRNRVAHEMPMVISDVRLSIDIEWLNRIRTVAAKFDRWWLRYFEIDHIDPHELSDEEIHSGNMIFMDLIPSCNLRDSNVYYSILNIWR